MYEVIVTEDFINIIKEISLRHVSALTNSFISIRKIDDKELDNTFMEDLLEQIKNQEKE